MAHYPPEPVLARGAHFLLRSMTFEKTPEMLWAWIRRDQVEAGYRGELLGRILLTRAVFGPSSDTRSYLRVTGYTTVATFLLILNNKAILAEYKDDLEKGYQTSRSCKHKSPDTRLSLSEVSASPVCVLSDVHAKDRKQLKAGNIHLSHWMAVECKISLKLLALAHHRCRHYLQNQLS